MKKGCVTEYHYVRLYIGHVGEVVRCNKNCKFRRKSKFRDKVAGVRY